MPAQLDITLPEPADRQPPPPNRSDASTILVVAVVIGTLILIALGAVVALLILRSGGDTATERIAILAPDESAVTTTQPDPAESPTTYAQLAPETTVAAVGQSEGIDGESEETPVAIQSLSESPLTLRGMGPVMLGMSIPEAEQALGADFTFAIGTPTECDEATIASDANSPSFMVVSDNGDIENGTIVAIHIGPAARTRSGIGIGDSKADVITAYGDRIVASPHPHDPSPGLQFLTYTPVDPADSNYRIIFDTTADQVTAISSGVLPFVEWAESCS